MHLNREDEERTQQCTTHSKAKVQALKAQLAELLKKPLVARGVSVKFITSGVKPVAEALVNGDGETTILVDTLCDD